MVKVRTTETLECLSLSRPSSRQIAQSTYLPLVLQLGLVLDEVGDVHVGGAAWEAVLAVLRDTEGRRKRRRQLQPM